MYHTQYGFYQFCFHVRTVGLVSIRAVLLGTRIYSTNSAPHFTRWMYLLHWRMPCSLFRIGIWFCSQSVCLRVFACDLYLSQVLITRKHTAPIWSLEFRVCCYIFFFFWKINSPPFWRGVRGGAVGRGTALQTGSSRVRFPVVSLEFFIDNPFGRTMALGSTQPLTEMSIRNIYWRINATGV